MINRYQELLDAIAFNKIEVPNTLINREGKRRFGMLKKREGNGFSKSLFYWNRYRYQEGSQSLWDLSPESQEQANVNVLARGQYAIVQIIPNEHFPTGASIPRKGGQEVVSSKAKKILFKTKTGWREFLAASWATDAQIKSKVIEDMLWAEMVDTVQAFIETLNTY